MMEKEKLIQKAVRLFRDLLIKERNEMTVDEEQKQRIKEKIKNNREQ